MMHWLSFFIGVLIGWGAEWLIDYFYWRRRRTDDNGVEVDLSGRLEKALGALQQMRIDLYDAQTSAKAEIAQLNRQLVEAQDEIASLRQRLGALGDEVDTQSPGLPAEPDPLDKAEDAVSEDVEPFAEEPFGERFDPGPVEAP